MPAYPTFTALELFQGRTKAVEKAFGNRSESEILPALVSWFAVLDGFPDLASIVQQYEQAAPALVKNGYSGGFHLDPNKPQFVSEGLKAFRAISEGQIRWLQVRYSIEGRDDISRSSDAGLIFLSLADRIESDMRVELAQRRSMSSFLTPASDRTVTIDHNQPEFIEFAARLAKVEEALWAANDYPDLDEKNQLLMEIAAGKDLLRGPKVRVDVLVNLLGGSLRHLAISFERAALGALAAAALVALKVLLGL
jgi:hypothetical protein